MKVFRVEFRGIFRHEVGFEFIASDTKESAQGIAIKLFGTLLNPIITKEVEIKVIGKDIKSSVHAYDEHGEKLKFEFN